MLFAHFILYGRIIDKIIRQLRPHGCGSLGGLPAKDRRSDVPKLGRRGEESGTQCHVFGFPERQHGTINEIPATLLPPFHVSVSEYGCHLKPRQLVAGTAHLSKLLKPGRGSTTSTSAIHGSHHKLAASNGAHLVSQKMPSWPHAHNSIKLVLSATVSETEQHQKKPKPLKMSAPNMTK